MKTSDSLEALHADFNAPESVVFDLVKQATGQVATERTKIQAGYDSEVYFVNTPDGKRYIVKIKREGRISYAQEAWAMEQARSQGVPVADVLLLDSMEIDGQPTDVMVQSVVAGGPLQARRGEISQEQFADVLREAGKLLRKIHQTPVSGAYRRNDDGTWSFPDWKALMRSMIDGRREEMELSIQGGIPREHVEDILARSERVDERVTSLSLVLNHGDFMPEHIYVGDDLKITGIIDFGDCKGAVAIHDFAFITLIGPKIPLAPILEGYGDERLTGMEDAIRDYAMLLGLGHLAHNVKKGRGPEVEHNRKRIEELLELR